MKTGAWMIDFAKSTRVPENIILNHKNPWKLGNHEDGYLTGLNNLIEVKICCFFNLCKNKKINVLLHFRFLK